MIHMDPGNRRADTLNVVAEGRVQQHSLTGEYRFVGGGPGSWARRALDNLVQFNEAGLIETARVKYDGWAPVTTTAAAKFLFQQWRDGTDRMIVDLPEIVDLPAAVSSGELPAAVSSGELPAASEKLLTDAGWSILNAWRVRDGWVAEVGRVSPEEGAWDERVFLLDARGLAYRGLSRVDAHALGAAILAAAR